MYTVQKLNNDQRRVEYILEHYPSTRDSDVELFTMYCMNFYPQFEKPIFNYVDLANVMRNVISYDHVARCRRQAIQDSKYTKWLPTNPEIARRRKINYEVWKKYAIQNNIPIIDQIGE